jgi:hypothetical protein
MYIFGARIFQQTDEQNWKRRNWSNFTFRMFFPIVVPFNLQFSCTMTLFDSIQIYEEQFKYATQSFPDIMFLKRYLTGP